MIRWIKAHFYSRRNIFFRRRRITAFLLCFLIIYSLSKPVRFWYEQCYVFPLKYPLDNILEIMKDLAVNGTTAVKPVNYVPFNYFYIHNANCSFETELIIVVKSYVGNLQQRQDIRSTWGSFRNKHVQTVFALGYSPLYETYVKEEHTKYRDTFQGSFVDKYRNNTYKTIMSYNWVATKCKSSRYVFFVDDDYFVNIPNILRFLKNMKEDMPNTMYGYKQCSRTPIRLKNHKWYVSEEEYPFDTFLPFISGGSVLTHINVVRRLEQAFPYVKLLSLDDVYISMTALKLNIILANEGKFADDIKQKTDVKNFMSSHYYKDGRDLYKAWYLFEDDKNIDSK